MNALLSGLASLSVIASLCGATVTDWPDLLESGFLSGRVAVPTDVEAGNAVFSTDGASAGPLDIAIPQYAFWTDEHGAKHPVIVIQAERLPDGRALFGAQNTDGVRMAGFMAELELLGQEKPKIK